MMHVLGLAGAYLTLIVCWSTLSWLGHCLWWFLREGRSHAAVRGMRYSAHILVVAGSGVVLCASVAGLDRLFLLAVGK